MLKYLDENGWALLFSVLTPLVIALIRYFATPRAKVSYMVISENWFPVHFKALQSDRPICTRTMVIRNVGRKEATNIEITHAMRPTVYKVQPATETDQAHDPTGNHFIKIKRLAARSQVVVETLTENDMPILIGITHDTGTARRFIVAWNQLFPWYLNLVFAYLFLAGFSLTVYVIARFLLAGIASFGWI